jgi:glycosyltransferase involved in cell wall biosynthesis
MEVRRPPPVNLLLVNYEYPPIGGGAANATFFLARTFSRRNITPVVLTSAFGRLSGYRDESGVHVYRVPALRKYIDRSRLTEMMLFPASAGMHVGRVVRKHAIERSVVFFTLPSGPLGYWMKRSYGIPYLVLLRGGDVPGHVPELNRIHRLVTPVRRLILSNAAAVIANDEGLAKRSMAADPYRVSVIPNGVDTDFFAPAQHTSHADGFHILFVGRFTAEKNLGHLLDQYAKLESAFPGKVSLRMVGDGPQMHEMKTYAAKVGLEKSVTWYGWAAKDQLRELYTTSSCFVNPSFYEGMPNTVLEAMASGLPVVVSDVPGNNTLVEDGRNGYVFDLKKPDAFFEALARMVQDPEGAASMGLQGRQTVVDNYSWDIIAEQFMKFLS